tara:strand:- start:105 stop:275 length:171 start_codon:yes stop_codon:yes gene_type:complete
VQTIRYFEGGLEDMDEYIIRLLDGRQISLKMATSDEVASAISIITMKKVETTVKKP